MINILSYVGMNMQSEVCLWTLLGLMRTIFDATLFKVNANLIQVWQMSMPEEMSLPVQHVLRTIISGIMLVQCFTVYVYLASYIVLLYPVFLEERPTLVLPWLLLAAIRKLLCELTSLALGLGTCILVGPAKSPCVRFLIVKILVILPAFYTWMLIYSYYHALKLAATFKTFPAVLPACASDYGLELAVRRRRTKSLLGEQQLRENLVAGLYAERISNTRHPVIKLDTNLSLSKDQCSDSSIRENELDILQPLSDNKYTDFNIFDDWLGIEPIIPRGSDRILEQFVVMLLKISSYLQKEGTELIHSQMFNTDVNFLWPQRETIESIDVTETPPHVANSRGPTASYLQEYPQIFMKKLSSEFTEADVWHIQNSTNMANSTTPQSINSNGTYNKVNPEINRISIEKAIDKLVLSKEAEVQHNSILSVIASRDTSLHNLEQNDQHLNIIDQTSSKIIPSTSKKDENKEENVNEEKSNLEKLNKENISLKSLDSKSVTTIMTKELSVEYQESNELTVEDKELESVNSKEATNSSE